MNTLIVALFLLAPAQNDTVTIKLTFAPILQSLQFAGVKGVFPAPEKIASRPWNGPFVSTPSVELDALPAGITSLSADPIENSVTVTGTPEAIHTLRKLMELLDVPARRVRMTIRAFRLDLGAVETLGLRSGEIQQVNSSVRILSGIESAGRIASQLPLLASGEVTSVNNQASLLHWSNVDRTSVGVVQVRPRVNGDLSVSISADIATAVKEKDLINKRQFNGSRRMRGNEPLIMLLKDTAAVVIGVKEIIEPKP